MLTLAVQKCTAISVKEIYFKRDFRKL